MLYLSYCLYCLFFCVFILQCGHFLLQFIFPLYWPIISLAIFYFLLNYLLKFFKSVFFVWLFCFRSRISTWFFLKIVLLLRLPILPSTLWHSMTTVIVKSAYVDVMPASPGVSCWWLLPSQLSVIWKCLFHMPGCVSLDAQCHALRSLGIIWYSGWYLPPRKTHFCFLLASGKVNEINWLIASQITVIWGWFPAFLRTCPCIYLQQFCPLPGHPIPPAPAKANELSWNYFSNIRTGPSHSWSRHGVGDGVEVAGRECKSCF